MMIDVHHHCLPSFLLEAFRASGRGPSLPSFPSWSPEESLAAMDRFAIDKALLSMAVPGVHLGDDGQAAALATAFNDYCADLSARNARFGAFGTLPLPSIDASLAEIAHVYDDLRLAGIGLFASYGEVFLGDPLFEPVMAELDRRDAIIFVHPMGHPSSRSLHHAAPLWMLEYPIDTTRAALNLILSGTLDRYPRIRFILAHGGGALPFLAPRLEAIALIDPRFPDMSAERVAGYLRQFYYETAQASGPETFAALGAVTSADHILFGSDFPYCRAAPIAAMVDNLRRLPGGASALQQSAAALFGRLV